MRLTLSVTHMYIFERFYRANLARLREGTVDLAIAQTLIEQLDGSITAISTTGKGSMFRMNLPVVLVFVLFNNG